MLEDKIILRPKPFRPLLLGVICAAFTAGGLLIAQHESIKGIFIASFFGLCTLVFIVHLIPGSNQLTLTKEGFIITSLFRSDFTEWSNISYFRVGTIGHTRFVLFDYSVNHAKYTSAKRLAKIISGNHGAIPGNYGLTLNDLCSLLNQYRDNSELNK
jgi:hypothetical protein